MAEKLRMAVTGATGYIGRHVAERLVRSGASVVNLTGHPDRPMPAAWAGAVETVQLDFARPDTLAQALTGVDTLFNTWWIRFERGDLTFDDAVRKSRLLIAAARDAGIRRLVQVSIAHPDTGSPLPYYRGKAAVEDAVRASGISAAMVRPTVVYGDQDVLINNIAWTLAHLPAFGIPGNGDYAIQPIFVGDLADLMLRLGRSHAEETVDAGGPERYTFEELVRVMRWATGSHPLLVHVPPRLALAGAGLIGGLKGDVMLTRDELRGLMAGLLAVDGPPTGHTSFAQWMVHHAGRVGRAYRSELARHYAPGVR